MNRGSHYAPCYRATQPRASMRPRFMNRGSARGEGRDGGDRPRFNEAPIHESGKLARPRRTSRPSSTRFNEAPIHESGK